MLPLLLLGVMVQFHESESACGGTFLAENGVFKSPGFPNNYPNNINCNYIIQVPETRVTITNCKINIENSQLCKKDYLTINGSGKNCGSKTLVDMWGIGPQNYTFHSDGSGNKKRGFVCRYRVQDVLTTNNTGSPTTPPVIQSTTTLPGCYSENGNINFDEVLHKSLLFYEAQRSGYLPTSNRVSWRNDSAINDAIDDATQRQVDLEGGYYDAGDHVKCGFPMAAMTTVLAWGAIEYKDAYEAAGELTYMKEAVKWATDYFIKAHPKPNVLYGQVGNSELDHNAWIRPEDMKMYRPAYKITATRPGSDLAGETAAAMAAASIFFNDSDSTYAATCLEHAKQLYNFANQYRGKYDVAIPDAVSSYPSDGGFVDELAWAAAWLYRATGNSTYLSQAEDHYKLLGGPTEFSWAEKTPGVQVLLAEYANSSQKSIYLNHLKVFCDYVVNKVKRSPLGLVIIGTWATLRYAANAAFVCLRAADLGITPTKYRDFANQQIGYILGDKSRSYVVGYGSNPPVRPHHSGSSCPLPPATCGWKYYDTSAPNPIVLTGALVGGPDAKDHYVDDRTDYVKNEVATDYNAGFQSAVAALRKLRNCSGK